MPHDKAQFPDDIKRDLSAEKILQTSLIICHIFMH